MLSCDSSWRANVAQDDGPIGDGLHFAEAVRDVDDRDAALAQTGHHFVQPRCLGQCQARGRLVHDEHAGVEREGFRDFDELALRDRQRGHRRVGRQIEPELFQIGSRDVVHLRPVDDPQRSPAGRLAAEEDIPGHVEVVEQVQLLVDQRDSARRRRVDVAHQDARAVNEHFARVGLLDAAGDLHQGGLTGAVFAQQGDDLSGVHVEAHAAQRVHAGKTLLDVAKLKGHLRIAGAPCTPASSLHSLALRRSLRSVRDNGSTSRRPAHRPRSCASFPRKSSTLFWRMTIVGMNN